MPQNDDSLGLALTSEEVDDALNFGMNFDDLNGDMDDSALPGLDNRGAGGTGADVLGFRDGDIGSLGTRSPSPNAYSDTVSLTSTGSKRSRADYGRGGGDDTVEEEQSSKKRVLRGDLAMGSSGDREGGDGASSAIRIDREREGRCPDCGLETHSIVRSETGYEKTPLNVEGEVLNGRCLFCHPLEEGEESGSKEKGRKTRKGKGQADDSYNEMNLSFQDVAVGAQLCGQSANAPSFRFSQAGSSMSNMTTPQQQQRRTFPSQTSITTSRDLAQNPQSTTRRRKSKLRQGRLPRKHSWKEHVKMMVAKGDNPEFMRAWSFSKAPSNAFLRGGEAPMPNNPLDGDEGSRSSQYSRNSQLSDGLGRLGKAMASGMGMSCAEPMATPKNQMQRQNSKSPHPQRRSPKLRDPPTYLSQGSFQDMSTTGSDGDVPAHVRLAHNKLPSSIYHHHMFPMSKETEQAYIEKTLAYLESGGGDICDVIVAMRRFPFSLPIQSIACEKLYVHCFDSDHAHAIGLVGGIRTVIDAMEHHAQDIALQRGCAGIIKHMAMASKYNLEMLDRMGAVRIIVNAMERNPQCAPLLESCCWALGSMARGSNPEIKMRVAKGGGIHAAMNAVEQFPRNESLLRAAFNCLQQLGYNPSSYNSNQNQQQNQQQMQNQQMLQQQQRQLQQQQQRLQRMMSQNDAVQNQPMQMNPSQQQQFPRMMSQNGSVQNQQMQMNPTQQQQLLSQQKRQMFGMSQGGGRDMGVMPNTSDDMIGMGNNSMASNMRMPMMGNMGNNSLLGNDSMTGNNDMNNSMPGNGINNSMMGNHRRM
ncbi:hypothetical protein HJC23_006405 [Cyclotella cryptica]|uniref:LRRK2 ARM repeat domain-containing protein n=1 Tax=Cyclotella cryptica TaxID=29204 RepID=A0ABD3QVQ1_9STRA|eukprot:CCRYP_001798-RA/>CCRYP_001798-RA protein AED:0.12 eAED:0.12 QI:749/1/1/1/0/0.5/2/95/809